MKPGKALEQLVKLIEQVKDDASMRAPKLNAQLIDDDGLARDIDVLLTFDRPDHRGSFSVAIECKDHKRKVEVGIIESFITKVQRLRGAGIVEGIMVSSNGFMKGAIAKIKATPAINGFAIRNATASEIAGLEKFKPILFAIQLCSKCIKIEASTSKRIDNISLGIAYLQSRRDSTVKRFSILDYITRMIKQVISHHSRVILTDKSLSIKDIVEYNDVTTYELLFKDCDLFLDAELTILLSISVHLHIVIRPIDVVLKHYFETPIDSLVHNANITVAEITDDRFRGQLAIREQMDGAPIQVRVLSEKGIYTPMLAYRKITE